MFPQEQPDRSGSRCPFRGWDFYFPTTEYSDLLPQVTLIRSYIQFFKECDVCRYRESLEDSVLIVFEELLGCKHPNAPKPTDIRDHPALIIPSLGLALYELESTKQVNFPHINLRLVGYEPLTKFRDLKSNMIGKFISLKGTVVRIGSVRPLVQKMAFLCTSCETTQVLTLSEGKYDVPRRCRGYQCRSRNFTPLHTSGDVQTIDSQIIKIQEILQSEGDDNGRIPRTLECELTSDLVGSCIPGDVVAVSGEVKVISSNEGKGKGKQNTFLIYLSVNAVEKTACIGEDGLADFTKADMYAISEIQEQPDVFRLIVHSLCPAIYGHELVKAGLVLSLFSSDQKYADDANKIAVRGDPHVLVVGDPGLGKSQLLRAVANVSPRGIYVCGNTASAAGLTVTLVREPGSSEYALEAGALVLADQGICCIDEFDKMGHEHESLLEAMELQSVSIAKAGIVSTLPARASLVAAANPAGGHYDKRKTVSENLKMSSALLSRFDLIFILLDKPNEQMDQLLSEHVMSLHRNKSSSYVARSKRPFQEGEIFPQVSLLRRFSLHDHEVVDHIPSSILRKYILYARNYCHPRLSRRLKKKFRNTT
ncbi:DNA helicase MCM8-like [Zophobas morio]|uniref:DNA helicase MCM8-like n=1 Tax=Zophobas morio TaxID=2755281 RepID=UPI003082B495